MAPKMSKKAADAMKDAGREETLSRCIYACRAKGTCTEECRERQVDEWEKERKKKVMSQMFAAFGYEEDEMARNDDTVVDEENVVAEEVKQDVVGKPVVVDREEMPARGLGETSEAVPFEAINRRSMETYHDPIQPFIDPSTSEEKIAARLPEPKRFAPANALCGIDRTGPLLPEHGWKKTPDGKIVSLSRDQYPKVMRQKEMEAARVEYERDWRKWPKELQDLDLEDFDVDLLGERAYDGNGRELLALVRGAFYAEWVIEHPEDGDVVDVVGGNKRSRAKKSPAKAKAPKAVSRVGPVAGPSNALPEVSTPLSDDEKDRRDTLGWELAFEEVTVVVASAMLPIAEEGTGEAVPVSQSGPLAGPSNGVVGATKQPSGKSKRSSAPQSEPLAGQSNGAPEATRQSSRARNPSKKFEGCLKPEPWTGQAGKLREAVKQPLKRKLELSGPRGVDGVSQSGPLTEQSNGQPEQPPSKVPRLILHGPRPPLATAGVERAVVGEVKAGEGDLDDEARWTCVCGDQFAHDKWIECTRKGCLVKWYHIPCSGIKSLPKQRHWYCKTCNKARRSSKNPQGESEQPNSEPEPER